MSRFTEEQYAHWLRAISRGASERERQELNHNIDSSSDSDSLPDPEHPLYAPNQGNISESESESESSAEPQVKFINLYFICL